MLTAQAQIDERPNHTRPLKLGTREATDPRAEAAPPARTKFLNPAPHWASAGDEFKPSSPCVETGRQEAAGDHTEWPEVKTAESDYLRSAPFARFRAWS